MKMTMMLMWVLMINIYGQLYNSENRICDHDEGYIDSGIVE